MTLANELKHVAFLTRQGGLKRVIKHAQENVLFDLWYKTETAKWLQTSDFANPPANIEHGVRYRASYTSEIMRGFEIADGILQGAAFFDLGCGKGKPLMLADRSGQFASITGIEYYEPFVNMARTNLKKINARAEVLHMDAAQFKAYAPLSIIYMYNPFDEFIMRKVIKNIEENTEQAVVIYNKPVYEKLFSHWKLEDRKVDKNEDRSTSIFSFGIT